MVAEVQLLENLPIAGPERVLLHIGLHAMRAVGKVEENRLPHLADRQDAARHPHEPIGFSHAVEGGGVRGGPFRDDFRHEVRGIPAIRVGRASEGGDARARRAPVRDLLGEIERLRGFLWGSVLRGFGHRVD